MRTMPVSYYPKDRADTLQLLRKSARALDAGDVESARIYHGFARAYIDDHPDQFPEYIHAHPS